MKETVLQWAVRWLARCFEDRAVDVEQPTVIAAPDPLIGNQTEFERGAGMGTVKLQEARRAAAVAECHEILTHNPQPPRQILQFLRPDDRLPEAAQILAAGCPRSDPGELLIGRGSRAMVISCVSGVQKRNALGHSLRQTRYLYQRDPSPSNGAAAGGQCGSRPTDRICCADRWRRGREIGGP